MTVDAWAQHPTERLLGSPMFASLRRWRGDEIPAGSIPIEATVAAMDAAGVDVALLSAWRGPAGGLISNDEVAGWVAAHPTRFRGLDSLELDQEAREAFLDGNARRVFGLAGRAD